MSERDDAPDRESRSADASARLYRQLPDETPPAWLDRTIRAEAEKAVRGAVDVESAGFSASALPADSDRPARPDHHPAASARPRLSAGWWSGWLPWAGSIAAGLIAVFVLLHEPLPIGGDERAATTVTAPSASAAATDSAPGARERLAADASPPAPPAQAKSADAAARETAIRENAASAAATPTDSRREAPSAAGAGAPAPARPMAPSAAKPSPVAPAPGTRADPASETGRRIGPAAGSGADSRAATPVPTPPFKDEAASPVQRHRDALQATPAMRDGATAGTAPLAERQDNPAVPADGQAASRPGSIASNPLTSPAAPDLSTGIAPPPSSGIASPSAPAPAREAAAQSPPRVKRREDVVALPNDPPNPAACERRVEVLLRDLRQHDAWLVYKRCRELFPDHEFPVALRRELPKGTTPEFR